MSMRIGIIGAGVLGRVLALTLCQRLQSCEILLFDRGPKDGSASSSYRAAGMLSPFCELAQAEPPIFTLGLRSLELWPKLLQMLKKPVFFQNQGTLVIADKSRSSDLNQFWRQASSKFKGLTFPKTFTPIPIRECTQWEELEPDLGPHSFEGIYFPGEGQIDSREFLNSSLDTLGDSVECHFNRDVDLSTYSKDLDWIVDCRGIGAQKDLPTLRAVRGEILRVEAKNVTLKHPIRWLHPRHPIYIVPRPHSQFLIGATQIESSDSSPISVRSILELLSSTCNLDSRFSEARLLETFTGLRPAFPNQLPQISQKGRTLDVNGLYRHGFLVSPRIAEIIADFIFDGKAIDHEYFH